MEIIHLTLFLDLLLTLKYRQHFLIDNTNLNTCLYLGSYSKIVLQNVYQQEKFYIVQSG